MPKFRMHPLRANNVLDLFEQRDLIDTDPPYQRLSRWDEEKQRLFIDSIINGVDIPKLYFHENPPATEGEKHYKYAVIDGKQRLQALWAFIDNALPLPSGFKYFETDSEDAAGKSYDDLFEHWPVLHAKFVSFDLPVTLVQTDDELLIEELFSRLNVQVPLNAPEKRNALGGPLPLTIRKIAKFPFFNESVRVPNDKYQHLDLTAKFLYVKRNSSFTSTKKAALDNFVLQYRRGRIDGKDFASSKNVSLLEQEVAAICESMHGFFNQIHDSRGDALLYSQGRIKLYFHIFRLYEKLKEKPPFSRANLEKFNSDVTVARLKSQRAAKGLDVEFTPQDRSLIAFDVEKQSTDDGPALVRQYNVLARYLQDQFQISLPTPDETS